MNSKHPESRNELFTNFNTSIHSHSGLRDALRDQPDYWTALMSAFLVACLLSALAMCSWQVEDWQNTRTTTTQSTVANQGFCVNGQHTF